MKKKGQYISKKKRQHYYKKSQQPKHEQEKQKKEQQKEKIITTNTQTLSNKKIFIAILGIILISFIAYFPTFQNELTNWDDNKYIEDNPLLKELNTETIGRMFYSNDVEELYWMGNYHPLTMLSLNINYQMVGEDGEENINPFIFQLTNILLHLICTILVFFITYLLFKNFPVAIMTALLFGVHTLHVESVSWISERKDVLYSVFYFASLLFYLKYALENKTKNYIFALIFFILSLFSKAQAVSLAITIIAVDYFYNRKLLNYKVILEKLPFIVLGLIFGLIAVKAQTHGKAIQTHDSYEFYKRIIFAGWAYTQYLYHLIVPINLSAIYPYPDIINKTFPTYYLLGLIPSIATVGLFFYILKRNREIAFGIIFFLINIALLLQLIPVGSAIYADRYVYIPSVGFFIIIAYIFYLSAKKIKQLDVNIGKNNLSLLYIVFALYVGFLSYQTYNRTQIWKNTLTLWEDVVKKQPKAVVALNNRGSEYNRIAVIFKDEYDYETYKEFSLKAIDDFSRAIEGKPDYEHAFYNRGSTKKDMAIQFNDTTLMLSAIEDFNFAINLSLKTNSKFALAFQERGNAFDFIHKYQKAINDFNQSIEFEPEREDHYINRGVSKGKLGKFQEAIKDFNIAIQINPNSSSAYSNRGLAKDNIKDYEGAIADYNKSIELEPEQYNPYFNRAVLYHNIGKTEEAIKDLTKVIEIKKDMANAYFQRGMYYIELKQLDNACLDFQTIKKLGHSYADKYIQKYCEKN